MSSSGPQRFSHLHQHTDYSLLDGAARIEDLVSWVKQVSPDDPAVAMTDHGNMHGAVQFYKTAVSMGVKPIIGLEAYVASGSRFEKRRGSSKLDGGYFHLTLLAKNFKGYQNLCRLSSRAYLEGFYMKPRVDLELLREHSEGVIALSGCLGAQIPRTILDIGPDAGEQALLQHLSIFGDDFFVELQNHGLEEQRLLNPILKEFADKHGIGMVATNDGHYVHKDDAHAHDVLLAIGTKSLVSDEHRMRFPCDEFYVKTPAEMAEALPESDYPGALANSNHVADLCNVDLPIGSKRTYQMPELPLPEGRTLAEQLRVDSYEGVMRRYPQVDEGTMRAYAALAGFAPAATAPMNEVLLGLARAGEAGRRPKANGENVSRYVYPHLAAFEESDANETAKTVLARVEFELGVIVSMDFPDYFLIVADFINWAKRNAIAVGPGRGSGAGSIVAYALGITNIDPLAFGLLFERFLNPDRVSMPDFDIDFSDVRRGEVIDYVREKYGHDKVAHIATFGTLASRAAIKDAARVMDAPFAAADKIAKLIPLHYGRSISIDKALSEVPELKEAYEQGGNEYIDVARQLEGLTRHASVHAAGVIIARHEVQELAPVFKVGDGPVVCQYDMGSIEELGFLKMDFLGLRTLSFIEAAVRIVKESRGVTLDPDSFPADDEETFALLARGESSGVFQFEGSGMIDTLKRLRPRRIHDLIAVGALFRPGPMENIPTYIRRHHGQEPVDYSDFPDSEKLLAPILAETYGIPVYQEQIMQIAQSVAGYSLGQADLLRRAMGKKKLEEMVEQRSVFQEGAAQQGIGQAESARIFDLLERFANYGFNKSHAAAYAVLSYQTAYLKAHYPVEFAAALLTVERGDSEKVAQYVADALHLGVEVLAPDINSSRGDFTPVGEVVRFGLYGIKNVGDGAVDHVLAERDRGGPFKDLFDLCNRIDTTVVNRRALEHLIKSGAMDSLVAGAGRGADRSAADTEARHLLLANLDTAMKWGAAQREQAALGQFSLFGAEQVPPPRLEDAPPIDQLTLLRYEKEALGLYISAHPMNSYPGLADAASVSVDGIDRAFRAFQQEVQQPGKPQGGGRMRLVLAGLLQNVVKRPTRKGGMMARFEVADESGAREVLAFGRTFDSVAPLLAEDAPVVALVELSEEGEGVRAIVERLIRWDTRTASTGGAPEVAVLSFDLAQVPREQLLELRSLMDEHSGRTPVRLDLRVDEEQVLYSLAGAAVDPDALDELRSSCPWLQARLTVDRFALLAEKSQGAWQQRKNQPQEATPF
ncbi:MAG: DNA polymerase III subunit alpha [Trueperaceae bacterium]|nr:DNA polymerase III subunit alpha [Trueperaceae bacterium]